MLWATMNHLTSIYGVSVGRFERPDQNHRQWSIHAAVGDSWYACPRLASRTICQHRPSATSVGGHLSSSSCGGGSLTP
jgi:hypothetical protein